jgi:hypothetical protein
VEDWDRLWIRKGGCEATSSAPVQVAGVSGGLRVLGFLGWGGMGPGGSGQEGAFLRQGGWGLVGLWGPGR